MRSILILKLILLPSFLSPFSLSFPFPLIMMMDEPDSLGDYYGSSSSSSSSSSSPFRSLLVFSSFKAMTATLLSPFEVSRIIWQVQYVPLGSEMDPSDSVAVEAEAEAERERERDRLMEIDLSKSDPFYLNPAISSSSSSSSSAAAATVAVSSSSSASLGYYDKLPIITGQLHAINLLWRKTGFTSLWKGRLLSPLSLLPPSSFILLTLPACHLVNRECAGHLAAGGRDDHPAHGGEHLE